jgi:hypothetical protein
VCDEGVFVMCEYYLLKDDVAKVLQATQMYEFQTKKNREKRTGRSVSEVKIRHTLYVLMSSKRKNL